MRVRAPSGLTNAILWLVAVLEALNQWFDAHPSPRVPEFLTGKGGWSYLPIALVSVYAALRLIRHFRPAPTKTVAPLPDHDPSPRGSPTYNDLIAIGDVRTYYRTCASEAASHIYQLLMDLRRNHLKGVTFAPLLDGLCLRLLEAHRTLDEVVADDTSAPVSVIQRDLVAFLRAYQDAVVWTHQCEKEGVTLSQPPLAEAYREWEERHERLVSEMTNLMVQAGTSPIRGALENIGLKSAGQNRYPVLYSKFQQVLVEPTPPQRDFLALFCAPQAQPIPVLAHNAFLAGEELARIGLLQRSESPAADRLIHRFCLSDAAHDAWSAQGQQARVALGLGPRPSRRCVEIDPHNVMGTGASGGGAQ